MPQEHVPSFSLQKLLPAFRMDQGTPQERNARLYVAGCLAIGVGGLAAWYLLRSSRSHAAAKRKGTPAEVQMQAPEEPPTPGPPGNGASEDVQDGSPTELPQPHPGSSSRGAGVSSNGGHGNNGSDGVRHTSRGGLAGTSEQPVERMDLPGGDSAGDAPFAWVDGFDEAFLVTTCPDGLKAKEVQCSILAHSLNLAVRGKVVASGDLFGPVQPDESTWELETLAGQRGKQLTVTLVKAGSCGVHQSWPSLMKTQDIPALNAVAV